MGLILDARGSPQTLFFRICLGALRIHCALLHAIARSNGPDSFTQLPLPIHKSFYMMMKRYRVKH